MRTPASRPPSLLALPSYLASQVSRYGRWHLETVLSDKGLTMVHHAILAALDDFGPSSQQEVADAIVLDKSHLVGQLDFLEGRELVTRERDPDDRRRHRLRLTGEGEVLMAELHAVALWSQEKFLSTLSEDERDILVSLLRRVLDANDAATLPSAVPEQPQVRPR